MAHTQVPGAVAQRAPHLTDRENQRAVDLIESAERSAPFCLCGKHMVATAEGQEVWLECSSQLEPKSGLASLIARVTAFGHTRRMIVELPTA